MAAVIIRKKDVERLGHTLLKEVYEFLHDDYILKEFIEMKEEQKTFLRNLIVIKFRNVNYTVKHQEDSWRITYEKFDESKYEEEIKILKDEIKNGSLDIEVVFDVLKRVELDDEIAGDLFFKKEAFLDLYKVIDSDYSYLED